ncbi:hypothetical protein [Clavibacter capsici]|uniref:Uncharacterized protein n=1 Tax=Clavibacter capsici TaxID=1874630 RepID=A0AAE6XS29_9MICO|nr:hypothetical protein [Clavibacter capsici]ALD13368.1 hypothetical protein AES38_10915 [Clavibacter capsici]QIS45560.1 hypothetical protein GW570_10900 [Clavibacter capsici]
MSHTTPTPSTRSSRRLRGAGSLTAAVALAVTATVGLGIAPASASEAPTSATTTTTVPAPGTGGSPETSLAYGDVRIQFQTHWTRGGHNVRAIRVQSLKGAGNLSRCYSMGDYRPGADLYPYIKVDLPAGFYDVISYDGPTCNIQYQTAGGFGTIDTTGHNWMVYDRYAPVRRG